MQRALTTVNYITTVKTPWEAPLLRGEGGLEEEEVGAAVKHRAEFRMVYWQYTGIQTATTKVTDGLNCYAPGRPSSQVIII